MPEAEVPQIEEEKATRRLRDCAKELADALGINEIEQREAGETVLTGPDGVAYFRACEAERLRGSFTSTSTEFTERLRLQGALIEQLQPAMTPSSLSRLKEAFGDYVLSPIIAFITQEQEAAKKQLRQKPIPKAKPLPNLEDEIAELLIGTLPRYTGTDPAIKPAGKFTLEESKSLAKNRAILAMYKVCRLAADGDESALASQERVRMTVAETLKTTEGVVAQLQTQFVALAERRRTLGEPAPTISTPG